jgi:uncharacterized protein (TIGR00106 family)
MLAKFSIIPLGQGAHFSKQIAEIINIINKSGLDYQLTSMGTIVEGNWKELMELIEKCHKHAFSFAERVYTTIAIDDFKGRTSRLKGKVESVEKILGKDVIK